MKSTVTNSKLKTADRSVINLVPRALFPLTSDRKTRALGASISGIRHRYHRCKLRTAQWNPMCRIRLFPLLLRSLKNAFIVQSKSTFLEFLDGNLSLQICPPPRKILQGQILQLQMTSLQSTMCFVCITFSFSCRGGLVVCRVS